MSKINYFPTYLALGEAFCNRTEELKKMIYHLEANNPILLMSPRRYGKTSLALKAFEKIQWPYVHIDLYKSLTESDIEQNILLGVGKVLGYLESSPQRLLKLAGEFFSSLKVRVVFEHAGISLDFSQKNQLSVGGGSALLEALEKLEVLAARKKQRLILYFDEFQVVSDVIQDYHLEAILREAAQKSKYVAYVFSGSNRHLMEQMFFDHKRPFYKLCNTIPINRIEAVHYTKYIQSAAKQQLKQQISKAGLDMIYELSEMHPYYVNKLCSMIWQTGECDENKILQLWQSFVLENKSVTERELALLNLNQRKVLIFFAREGEAKEVFAQTFSGRIGMPVSSISSAVKSLLEKDYLYQDSENTYRILDPLIKSVLRL